MEITVKHLSASEEGDYFALSFNNDDPNYDGPDYNPTGPYLIVQRQFEDGDDRICYVETHDHDWCGHFRVRLISFSDTRFVMEILDQDARQVSVGYNLPRSKFEAIESVVNVIFSEEPLGG